MQQKLMCVMLLKRAELTLESCGEFFDFDLGGSGFHDGSRDSGHKCVVAHLALGVVVLLLEEEVSEMLDGKQALDSGDGVAEIKRVDEPHHRQLVLLAA
jgi:hypothetical protein